jgi:hypothetical protein
VIIHPTAGFSAEDLTDIQGHEARSPVSYLTTQSTFSNGRNENSLVTENSNGAEIMRTQDNDSETHTSDSRSGATGGLHGTHSTDSTSNENAKAIDSFFAQSSADANFLNLA